MFVFDFYVVVILALFMGKETRCQKFYNEVNYFKQIKYMFHEFLKIQNPKMFLKTIRMADKSLLPLLQQTNKKHLPNKGQTNDKMAKEYYKFNFLTKIL